MSFIISGAATAGRMISTYANKAGSEKDAWDMIKNFAIKFFRILTEAFKEAGYKSVIWGACAIVVGCVVIWAAFHGSKWVLRKMNESPPPNNEESAPLSPSPTHQLDTYLKAEIDPTIEALEEMIVAINTKYDASTLSSHDQTVIQKAKVKIDELRQQDTHIKKT